MQFILELEPDSEPTNGCLRDAEGRSFEFVGWLGFPTALGQALMETAGRRPRLMTGRLTARIARASGATTDEAPPIEFSRLGRESRLPRVPAVVASPYAKSHAVTDIVHDHTSVLATFEAKWNLSRAHLPRRQTPPPSWTSSTRATRHSQPRQ